MGEYAPFLWTTFNAGEESTLKVRGLFYGIGHQPNSHLFADDIELDDAGYVKVLLVASDRLPTLK